MNVNMILHGEVSQVEVHLLIKEAIELMAKFKLHGNINMDQEA